MRRAQPTKGTQSRVTLLRNRLLPYGCLLADGGCSLVPGPSPSDGRCCHYGWLSFIGERRHWLMPHGRNGHPSDIIDAVDNVGPPDVISEGEDFSPDVTE